MFYKKLKEELNKVHRLQWHKKSQLRNVIKAEAECIRCLNRNSSLEVPGHSGAKYVPWEAAKYLSRHRKSMSSIQKQINENVKRMRYLEGCIEMLKRPMVYEITMMGGGAVGSDGT